MQRFILKYTSHCWSENVKLTQSSSTSRDSSFDSIKDLLGAASTIAETNATFLLFKHQPTSPMIYNHSDERKEKENACIKHRVNSSPFTCKLAFSFTL